MKITVSVRIDEDLHKDVKSVAPKRKMTLEAAYDQALRRWLDEGGLSGNSPVNGGNIAPTTQGSVENPTLGVYNSLHVVEAARRAVADLETALEKDATATKERTDRLGKALPDAESHLSGLNTKLTNEVDRIPKRGQKGEGKSRKVK